MPHKEIAIIGGGPAGLMAAEVLSGLGHAVSVYDAMPTVGRKFLLAGKSGLNITHAEDYGLFAGRYGVASARLASALDAFKPGDIRSWADSLGAETFAGSSGRIFPKAMKASPLLRRWLARLQAANVRIVPRHRWVDFDGKACIFETPAERISTEPDAVLLALGGASWPRLGSDAQWVPWVRDKGVPIYPFKPANCGFDVAWSPYFQERFAGAPVKSVTATSDGLPVQGEFVVSRTGIEGSLVYTHAASLRNGLESNGAAELVLDLAPGRTIERLEHDLARQDHKASLSNRLRKAVGLDAVKIAMLREFPLFESLSDPRALARRIKALPIPVLRPRPIAEAISVAGGIAWDGVGETYMLDALPGVFVAGEMLDWEAPTGGYLLSACFATGRAAALGIDNWLRQNDLK